MQENFSLFFLKKIKGFIEVIINILIFLPYFFSVSKLIKTLFHPWKNLVVKKTKPGFDLGEWLNRKTFNFISRGIGFFMRFSLLFFYFILQIFFIILIPFIFIIYLTFLPFLYLKFLFEEPLEQKIEKIKNKFMKTHLLKDENREKVIEWFKSYYSRFYQENNWWKIYNLITIPPLARDWAVGYTPSLDNFCDELTSSSYQKKIKNIIDREKEINQIERLLSKAEEANVLIVGEEGIGKHTIVDALSKKIYEGLTTSLLAYKRILKINMEKVLSEKTDKIHQEKLLEDLLFEAAQAKNIIVFIDHFEKYYQFFSVIEKFAKTPDIQFIGITTPFFYQKIIFPREKIIQFFSKVNVYEVSKEEAVNILLNLAFDFEIRYNLIIPYETIKTIIEKSDYYITYIPFPEKAIQLLDEACVITKEIYAKENQTKKNLNKPIVLPETIDKILMEKIHMPITFNQQLKEKLLLLEKLLRSNILHQEETIKEIVSTLKISFITIGKRKKPLASFLFLGPTGVGKTETAKTIAEVFFKTSTYTNDTINIQNQSHLNTASFNYLLRFDMSLYQSKKDIPKLIGSPETGTPGLLTTAIREHPFGVLLLDELEKADRDLINIFLTILDEGYFTDGYGKRVDCKNLIIIATSNAGSSFIYEKLNQKRVINLSNFNQTLVNYLIEKNIFSPEFLNRFDGIIFFKPLTHEAIIDVAKKIIKSISQDIYRLHKIKLIVSEEYLTNLAYKSYHPQFGARDMERLIKKEIEDKIAKMLFENKIKEGEKLTL